MSIATTIAEEFPLLAAIADELGGAEEHSEVERLHAASRLLREALRSFDRTGRGKPDTLRRRVNPRLLGVSRVRHDDARRLA